MKPRYIAVMFFVISVLSCKPEVTKNMEKIKLGMSKEDVITIIGNPISIGSSTDKRGEKTIYYTYPNSLFSASGNVVYFDTNMVVIDISTFYN